MEDTSQTTTAEGSNRPSSVIEIVFFKSDTCGFCFRAEEVLHEFLSTLDPKMFMIKVINVSQQPEAAEAYGVLAVPTIMIGSMSLTGIPEPDVMMKMILGHRLSKKGSVE
ncbi:MAG: thioredoxin family protein [Candidatus Thorarchaeota archaeon]|nr:thioredoxin family protein [Candidatus Thorarchaeota archaeon]